MKEFEKATQAQLKLLNDFPNSVNNWKSLYTKAIKGRSIIDVITKQSKVDAIVRYYTESALRTILEPLEFNKRWKFLDEFGSVSELSEIRFNKIKQNPKKLEAILEIQNTRKKGYIDMLENTDFLTIIDSNIQNQTIDFLRIKNQEILSILIKEFKNEITEIGIDLNRLYNIQNGDLFNFFSGLSNRKKLQYKSVNKLLTEIQIYNNDTPIGNIIKENYITGREEYVKKIFSDGLKENFKEPINYFDFDAFKQKAFDLNDVERFNDTEIKFIFNFLEQHWTKGNHFKITMESTLYTCQSCQGYILYLKKLAKNEGKNLEIIIKSHPKAEGYKELDKIINP